MEFNKKQKIILIIGLIMMLALIYHAIISTISSISGKAVSNSVTGGQVAVTKENFYLYLESQKMIQELPKNAYIYLRLYNFDAGVKQLEKSYVITKGNVEETDIQSIDKTKLDAEVIINSKYGLSYDLCTAIRQAIANNEFEYELKSSTTSLLWKYRGMIKYKNCFW